MKKLIVALFILIGFCYSLVAEVTYSDSLFKAATDSIPSAQYKLGLCYENGSGIEKNMETAMDWYYKAALQGYVDAEYKYGFNLFKGKGKAKDTKEAIRWLRDAANGFNAEAQICMAYLFKVGDGVEADLIQAYFWAAVATACGSEKAQEYKKAYGLQLGSEQSKEIDANVEKFMNARNK